MKAGIIALLVLGLSVLQACKNQKPKDSYDKIVIGFSGGDDPSEKLNSVKSLKPYFEKELGVKKVEFYVTTDYAAIIEAMRSKKVDIAQLGELSYILAAERSGAEAIIMAGTVEGYRFTSSVILTSSKSGLNSMDDVKARAKELSLTFGDPASTSGHLFPRNYLNSIYLTPEKSFRSVVFTANYSAAILTAVSGKVDLACTFSLALDQLIAKKRLSKSQYKVLWESEPYITTPIAVRGDLPDDLKKRIQNAYLNLPKKEPVMWDNYKNTLYIMYPPEIRKKLIYIPSHDSMYNGIRKIARNCEGFKFMDNK